MTTNNAHIDIDDRNAGPRSRQMAFGRLWQLGARSALAAMLLAATAYAIANAPAQAGEPEETQTVNEAESTQPVEDTWITTKVKSQLLAEGEVEGSEIDVDTLEGVVHLSGTLGSQAEIDKAVAIARATEGVTEVDASGLTVSTTDTR
ncbi:BON domain-containing protein [Marilutibacter chinensis]|uniref:BON domain-containing protein n=1 Tax=Marilutibacter chinensis TaxID=2912247 RepID=A0ABS9HT85_9GAMM|nr:BON domain-containing protein [Lysobacter chinensis]MCF7221908.1 BON domain-containing protein [Lysobacter chinensis]